MPCSIMAAASRVEIAVGQLDQSVRRHTAHLGVGTGWHTGVGNPVTFFKFRYAGADRIDPAGTLKSENRRQGRQGIEAGPLIDVNEIEADRLVDQSYFARSWGAGVIALPGKNLGAAG